jgi:hypothetical protein
MPGASEGGGNSRHESGYRKFDLEDEQASNGATKPSPFAP